MEKLRKREHDFSSKLRQESTIKRLREYIGWQRDLRQGSPNQPIPHYSPVSINLDLTSACNFSCPFCVDSTLTNSGKKLKLADIKKTLETLRSYGLLSVILIGGGEPTLHKTFSEVVRFIKERKLQVGIVTNGSKLDAIAAIVPFLEGKDWIRISIDASQEGTFKELHRPRRKVSLHQILEGVKRITEANPAVSIGYSFLVVWEGIEVNGCRLKSNVDEIHETVELAEKYGFDYVSLKPCLIRLEESHRESLLDKVDKDREEEIIEKIKAALEKAKGAAQDKVKILESVNLRAMLEGQAEGIKKQPKMCHLQFFRTVVSPSGIFHCPSLRGVAEAKIAESGGYMTEEKLAETLQTTAKSVLSFDAAKECSVVGCFYHDANWWLEDFIHSGKDVSEIEEVEDENFFL